MTSALREEGEVSPEADNSTDRLRDHDSGKREPEGI